MLTTAQLRFTEWRKDKHHRLYVQEGTIRLGYLDLKRGTVGDEPEVGGLAATLLAAGLTLTDLLRRYCNDPHEYEVRAIFPDYNPGFLGSGAAYRLYFDGGTEGGNPGDGYGSYCLFTADAGLHFPKVSEPAVLSQFAPNMTNNVAEYLALISGLEALHARLRVGRMQPEDCVLDIWGDSQLVIEQTAGNWAVNKPHLVPYQQTAHDLVAAFGEVQLRHHYRVHSLIHLGH